MGLVKILILTVGPVTGLLYWTFKLGKQLPTASRLMGNYIGLSYIYLKVGLKALKPANDIGVEILDIVRKTSQQAHYSTTLDKSIAEIAAHSCQRHHKRSQAKRRSLTRLTPKIASV